MEREKLPRQAEKNVNRHRELALISQVAHMYYDLGMLQPEIARKLYFSRSKVSRMLSEAREKGIVEIKVRHIVDRAPMLEKKLHEAFSLSEALVVTSFEGGSEYDALESLSDFAALHISSMLKGIVTVGVTNGRAVNAVVRKLRRQNPCTLEVVELMGSTGSTLIAEETRSVAREMLATFGGSGSFLNAPLYIGDGYARNVLVSDPIVSEVFAKMRACDMIITGVGAPPTPGGEAPRWYGYLNDAQTRELIDKGAAGSICARYFDAEGREIDCEWNARCVSMELDDVRRNPNTVAVVTGKDKALPVLAALRGGLINTIITDAATASAVLELGEK